ncbi:MAG: maleate isomerase [Alphaproteobacteria bacterium]|jgi:maleate isomerase|nr:maleate isomerase [Alphaproteobacteria bacterium]
MTASYEPIVPRARIGFIIPSSNRMIEPQMQRFMPSGVVPHFSRIGMTNRHKAPLEQLIPRITAAADLLADSKCDVTVLQCTGTSMSGGVEMDKRVVAEIEKVTKRPALSTASALNAAFAALDAKRLVFISETKQADHESKLAYLREAGFDIVADKATSLAGSDAYCTTPPRFWYDTAMALRNDAADAYFLSCANIHSVDTIEDLERDLGRPVVTSNQAALWCSLRAAGIRDDVRGLGALLRLDLKVPAAVAA